MVGDKVVCERWCVTDGGWQSGVKEGVSKMVCDKVECESWCGERWFVEDGVWQRWCVKNGVSKIVCERWSVTKWCVKDGPTATNGDQARHQVQPVPRLPRKTKVDVAKCHACHVKWRWMSPSATPATWNEGECHLVPRLPCKVAQRPERATTTNGDQARHQVQQVQQVPRLPRNTKVDVAKCHACHVKKKVDVTKCHACHVKWRWMSPCATPATQSGAAPRATNGDQRRPSAPPSATSATPATWNEGRCQTQVDVSKCHACHVKRK